MVLFGKKKYITKNINLDEFVESKIYIMKNIVKNNKTILTLTTLGGLYYIINYLNLI